MCEDEKSFEQFLKEAFEELEIAERELAMQALYEGMDDHFEFEPLSGKTAILTDYTGEDETAEIPAQVGAFTVTAVGRCAFLLKEGLQAILLPDTVETIRDFAVQNCRQVQRIVLPRNLRNFGKYAIYGAPALQRLELPGDCAHYTLRDGILYNREMTELIFCPPACGLTRYVVPDTVRKIRPRAFYGCRTLREIRLPEGLRSIGEWAFANTGLTNVILPDSLTELEDHTFAGCRAMEWAALGADLWRINGSCFSGCPSLKIFFLDARNTDLQMRDGYLLDSSGRKLIYALPGQTKGTIFLPSDIHELGCHAFDGCTEVVEVVLHSEVEQIGTCAFEGCSSLQRMELPPKVTVVEDYVFCDCTALKQVELHEAIRTVSGFAFVGCSGLKKIRLHRHTIIDTPDYNDKFYHCPARIEIVR